MADERQWIVGRFVEGNLFTPYDDKDQQGNITGQHYYVGVAVQKTDPTVNNVLAMLNSVAQLSWPRGEFQANNFSWKYKDGDQIAFKDKEGWQGCWVFSMGSLYPFSTYRQENGQVLQITDKSQVKCGDYVRVPFVIKSNNADVGKRQTPGIKLYPELFEVVGYGSEIKSGGADPSILTGAPAVQLPAGASATPVAPTAGIMPPGQPSAGQQFQAPQGAPAGPQFQPPQGAPAGPQFQAPQGGPQFQAPGQQFQAPGQQQPIPPHYGPLNTGAPTDDIPY